MNYLGRTVVATMVSAAILWTLALSVSPALHSIVHSEATQSEHTCAATLIQSGSCEHVAPPANIGLPSGFNSFTRIAAFFPPRVASLFSGMRVFEHAPPLSA